VEELRPLGLAGRGAHELEEERAARDDRGAAREEVAADERLEDGRLAGRLGADDRDLGQVQPRVGGDLQGCEGWAAWARAREGRAVGRGGDAGAASLTCAKMSWSLLITGMRR
jgi:hypothetical protein